MGRRPIFLLFALLLVVGAWAALRGVSSSARPTELPGTILDPPLPAPDFSLTSAAGPVHLSDLKGKTVVLFFGYTSCPDVCPTTMARLGEAVRALGRDSAKVQVVMISVDPETDTPEVIDRYAKAFHPSFLGLTGTADEVAAVASSFWIHHAKEEGSGHEAMVDHTSTLLVLDKDAGTRLLMPSELSAEEMARALRVLAR
jgi:protein SCO1/2